jgi:hypothetical protein
MIATSLWALSVADLAHPACLLADGPIREEIEHQLRYQLGLAVDDWARPALGRRCTSCSSVDT